MRPGRLAIIGVGVFITTAAFAVAQSGVFGGSEPIEQEASDARASTIRAEGGSADDYRWTGRLDAGLTLEIKGINGEISVERATGDEVEVVADARGRRSDPSTVRIERVEHAGGITFCAVYPTPEDKPENVCAAGSDGRMNNNDNDVSVDFEVRVPDGVHFVGRTVNGDVDVEELTGDVTANTVNGSVAISTAGFARAETVNGDIDIVMGAPSFADGAEFQTVNGSITLDVYDGVDADISAKWLNGGFESEIPFMADGGIRRHSARGVLGDGGPALSLETVNGSIHIR